MKIWPWSRFAELEARNGELVLLCAAIARATNALIVDASGTVIRNADFGNRKIYVTADARNTLIESCRFSTKPEESK